MNTPKATFTYRCEKLGSKPNERDLALYSLGWEDGLRAIRVEISAMLVESLANAPKQDRGNGNAT